MKETRLRDYGICILLALALFSIYRTPTAIVPRTQSTITINGTTIAVLIARTPEEHQTGLSGRTALPEGSGMLFIFDHPDRYGFWMPDMYFAIDIIWISTDWRIVDISKRVPLYSYPNVFTPSVPAQYVLEVLAGSADRYGWKVGDEIDLTRSRRAIVN